MPHYAVLPYVYELMDRGGPTDPRAPYFKEAVEEMMRARTLCAKANAAMPDDPAYVGYLEELFGNTGPARATRSTSLSRTTNKKSMLRSVELLEGQRHCFLYAAIQREV